LAGELCFYTKGEKCLEDLHKNPSVIILDYNLEGEMNGLDTLQEIRKHDPSVYVILFSNQKEINTKENKRLFGVISLRKRQVFRMLKKMIHAMG
jgi:DNA-binding NtrC family response regulator